MTNLNISLPDGLKSFVDRKLESEGYRDASEYILDLIEADQQLTSIGIDDDSLRRAAEVGIHDIENGRFIDYESPEQIAEAVKSRGMEWMKQRRGNGQ